jgi:hypothetical protein
MHPPARLPGRLPDRPSPACRPTGTRARVRTLIRSLPLLALLVPSAGTWAAATPAVTPPREFTARYEARVMVVSGAVLWRLRVLENGESEFQATVHAGGFWQNFFPGSLDETSRFEVVDGRPRPVAYRSHNGFGSKEKDGEYRMDWVRNVVTGRYRDQDVRLPLEPGTVDRALVQVALMYDLAREVRTPGYALVDRDKITRVQVAYGPTETVEVPAGRFEALRVTRRSDDGNDETRLWCAPALRYLPVQVEQYKKGSRQFLARLVDVQGLKGDPRP